MVSYAKISLRTMSSQEPSPKSSQKAEAAPDLSALDFGPAWAKKDQRSNSKQKSPRRGDNKGRERRSARDGRKPQTRREGRSRQQSRPERKPLAPPPEGITARIMPLEEGLDAMAKEIIATGRTHSVFDLAWVVLGARDRFHVIFENEKEGGLIFKNRHDHSVWLTQQECLAHFWAKGRVKEYYQEEVTEVDAPSGNFQSIARCGLSGKLIGPPNFHAYQQRLVDLHRERYSDMPLERYKEKIVMEHGDEVVAEWLETMKKRVVWKPLSEEGEEVTLDTRQALEKHFLTNGFEKEFESGKMASVLANIPANMLSPGLLTLLKNTVAEEKRYPGNLASFLCRQMSGRHLAVYKWKKRLHCGPARPKQLSKEVVIADRPNQLFKWVQEHSGGAIDKMWEDLLPEDIDEETRHLWYHDLHWLINEGFVLLFSDGLLYAAKASPDTQDPPKK